MHDPVLRVVPLTPTVRTFVAVEIADAVRAELERLQKRLRRLNGHVGWVAPANLHITLAFLGDTPRTELPLLQDALDAAVSRASAFPFAVTGTGFFGSPRAPKVVWCGVGDGADALMALQRTVAARLGAAVAHREDKPFHAHVTLGRVRSKRGAAELLAGLEPFCEKVFGNTQVAGVRLMQSDLLPTGPLYTCLHEARLAPPP